MKVVFLMILLLVLINFSGLKLDTIGMLHPEYFDVLPRFLGFGDAYAMSEGGRANYSSPELQNLIPENKCDCVAFRLDDIQNGWLPYIQLGVIEKFKEKNIPLTIGLIGNDFKGFVATFVNQTVNEENSKIELANHSWQHSDFTTLDKETQSQLMQQTNKKIFEITGKTPRIFIPPYNIFNNDTIEAMKENGFTHFSSSVVKSNPPYPFKNLDLFHFPETATTGVISPKTNLFEGLSHTETLKDIESSQKIFGFSVVVLHPQDFSVIENGAYTNQLDEKQIQELDLLISQIQKSNLKIVFLSQINENLEEQIDSKTNNLSLENQIPDWIRTNARWWSEDKIGDSDFVRGIQYLIGEEIMKIPLSSQSEHFEPSKEIPSWIKNNAGWWADGQITDDEFVKGILYLVETGTIAV